MKMKNKKIILIFGSLFLFFIFSTYSICAYLMDGDKAENKFIIGGNRIELIEDFQPPKEITPGISFTKDVKVKNVGTNSCFFRIKAVFTDSDMENYCSVDWNNKDFIYNEEDGYYYYPKILNKDEISSSLFTKVTVDKNIPIAEIKDFDILVYTESYQAAEFTDYQKAWKEYQKNKPIN